jgi:integrase
LLSSLSTKLEGVDSVKALSKSKTKIMAEILKMKSTQSQKTLLSALYILTGNEDYKEKMMVYINETNKKYRQQKVNTNLKETYLTKTELQEVYDRVSKRVKQVPSIENYVNYLIVSLMSGLFIAPRRLEYAKVKIKNFDTKTDNYLDIKKKVIGFNVYKTYKTYGFQLIELPKEVVPTLKRFLKINETDHLLIKNNGKPLSASDLSKRIGTIFGDEKMGVDVLRSMYVSRMYKNVPELVKLEKVANEMGHSVGAAMTYYKKNDLTNEK